MNSMNNQINIITVLCDGEHNRYNIDDVYRVMKNVAANTSYDIKFWCLTNIKTKIKDCNSIELKYNLPGWWSKLELFRDDLPFRGRTLYLDLDVLICNHIDKIIEFEADLAFASPFHAGNIRKNNRRKHNYGDYRLKRSGKVVVYNFQSSVISFIPGKHFVDFDGLADGMIFNIYRGDQDYFGLYFSDAGCRLPETWVDKLRYCYEDGPTQETSIILGHPKRLFRKAVRDNWLAGVVSNA